MNVARNVAWALFVAGCAIPRDDDAMIASEVEADPSDAIIAGTTPAEVAAFNDGDEAFGLVFRDGDGLGPLFTQQSCAGCHEKASRGPGSVQKMVVVERDGVTPSPDQSRFPYGPTVHPLVAGGAHTPIAPVHAPDVLLSIRVGPSVLGRGYVEAIRDDEIERLEREQAARSDAIHGRINRVLYASEPNPATTFPTYTKGDVVIGRFGLKARIATLDDFTADAFQGDMGITSPLRPREIPNPDGLADDRRPGIDVGLAAVNKRANYMRLIAIPRRNVTEEGAAAFAKARCSICHNPSMRTHASWPIAALAGIDAPIFSDLLLHDMGDRLADGVVEGKAGPRDWRTPPLIGLRFDRAYLHDGRAATIEDAVMLHEGPGSEANDAVAIVRAMSPATQTALFSYVKAL
jgi:CxxC motif-containing protein (DUF1111 family)